MKKMDVIALGELLIDFTQNGVSEQGNIGKKPAETISAPQKKAVPDNEEKIVGMQLKKTQVNQFCPYCGASVNGQKFCGQCGKRVN